MCISEEQKYDILSLIPKKERRCPFLLTRDGLLNHFPIKLLVICQPLMKFDTVVSLLLFHTQCVLYNFFQKWGAKAVYASNEESISKTRETITLIILRSKVCQNIPLKGHKHSTKNNPELGKRGLSKSRSLRELLKHRVKRRDKNLQKFFQNASLYIVSVNPIQDGRGGAKRPPTSFSPVTSTKVRISPKSFLTFSFNSFDRLV